MHFTGLKYAEDKARHRLREMVRSKRLQVTKMSQLNVYHIEKFSRDARHWLAVVDAYLELSRQKKSWEQYDFKAEQYICNRRPDLLLVTINKATGEKSVTAVEVDLGTTPFQKVAEYNETFDLDWTREWWADLNRKGQPRFPRIIVFTTRPEVVKEHIEDEKENRNRLRWEVVPCGRLLP